MNDALDIVLASSGMPHDGTTLARQSLGGSETAAINVAKALAARGHHVVVLSPGHTGSVTDGVQYLPIELAPQYLASTPHDLTVISRAIDACGMRMQSAVRWLWCHDLALKRNRAQLAGVAWALDGILGVSEFHTAQLRAIHTHLPPTLFRATRNGVDLPAFRGLDRVPRDPWLLVYGSRPERGLPQALDVMDRLARTGEPWALTVSHYENTTPQMQPHYEAWWARAQAMPNVRLLGPLRQAEWRQQLAKARALLYPGCPGEFRETFGLVIAEAQAAGTPVIAAAKGAVPEVLGNGGGILVGDEDTDCGTSAHLDAVADAVRRLADERTWSTLSATARSRGAHLGWDGVAAQWETWARAAITARAASPERVRRHLLRIGDREAAGA